MDYIELMIMMERHLEVLKYKKEEVQVLAVGGYLKVQHL